MTRTSIIDCSRNEFLFPHPLFVDGSLPELSLADVCRYRGTPRLTAVLSERFDIEPELICLHSGAEQALKSAFSGIAAMRDATLLLPSPGWDYYSVLASRFGISTEFYHYREESDSFALDLDELVDGIRRLEKPIVLLSSPSNPLGCRLSEDTIGFLTQLVSEKGYTILDQTYAGYAGHATLDWSFSALVRLFPQTLIVRSMSKFYGIAGLRTGYTISSLAVRSHFAMSPDYLGFNAFSDVVACECVRRHSDFELIAGEIVRNREELFSACATIEDFKPFKSMANFILLRTSGRAFGESLLDNGIRVRQFLDRALRDCVRITIPPESTRIAIVAIARHRSG